MTTDNNRPLAVVTGASSGIGLELAKLFAAADFDLVIAAEDDQLRAVGEGIRLSGASVDAVQVDLATPEGVEELAERVTRPVDALALREELKDTGVTVTTLMPGPTDTEFFERADMLDTKVGAGDKDDPADVARDGFDAMMAGKERVVSHSLSTKVQGRGSRFLPDSVKAEMHRRQAEPGTARK